MSGLRRCVVIYLYNLLEVSSNLLVVCGRSVYEAAELERSQQEESVPAGRIRHSRPPRVRKQGTHSARGSAAVP